MGLQPLNTTKSCPPDDTVNVSDNVNVHTSSQGNTTKTQMLHACRSIFVIAALAYSATSVNGFSTIRYSITNRNISTQTQKPIIQNPTFITNAGARARLTVPVPTTATAIFMSNSESTTRKPKSDQEEWNALLAAFQMYKAAYGDLKVPSRFVVPAMPPWPGK